MTRLHLPAVAALALFPALALAGEPPTERTIDVPRLVKSVLPAVVNISILKQAKMANGRTPEGAQEMVAPEREVGSGFIIDPAGYIVTNRHVIADAYNITVTLQGGFTYDAQVVSTNEKPDLALLKIDAGHPLPTLRFGESDDLEVGDTVIAIGNPLGLASSVSTGVVSALNRNVDVTSFDNYIQTDAAINHGNSGGPLFNAEGEVVGVNWALIEWSQGAGSIGLGLSIPSHTVQFVVDHMRRYGHLRPGWIGVQMQTLEYDLALAVGRKEPGGALISHVDPASPALKVLEVGDVVLSFDGKPTADIRALARLAASAEPGSTHPVTVWRDGQEVALQVPIANWPTGPGNPVGDWKMPDRGERISRPNLGMKLSAITDADRGQFKLPANQQGVIVEAVAANSPGADVGFKKGDVILQIEDMPVGNMLDLESAVTHVMGERLPKVPVLVRQGETYRWLAVPTDVK